jgi:hypothetical protein
MANAHLRCGALLVGLLASTAALAAIGDFTGTSTPTVIIPPSTPAPQTPAYPSPPIGTVGPGYFSAPLPPPRGGGRGGGPHGSPMR